MLKKHKDYSKGELFLSFGIMAIIAFTLWYAFTANSDANKIYDSLTTSTVSPGNALKIESDPSGVNIKAEKYCDSSKLDKKTPYTCSVPRSVKSIALTAPTDFTKDGKKYTFEKWTGCDENSADKKTCTVSLPSKNEIRSTYALATSTKPSTPPPAVVTGPKANCNGTVINNGKTCRFVVTYDEKRQPGRFSATPIKKNPNSNIYEGLSITAECSLHEACSTYEANPKQTTGPVTGSGIDFSINKPTDITIDVPMSQDTGSAGGYYLLSQFVYNKATYANGGGGTYFDSLTIEYTLEYKL